MTVADYTGFETQGYDEDIHTKELPRVEHHLHKPMLITAIHNDNAFGKVFNQSQKDHTGNLVIAVEHGEHERKFVKTKHIYGIEKKKPKIAIM